MTESKKSQNRKALSRRNFPGVYYIESKIRRYQGRPDRSYYIQFRDTETGALKWERVGNLSQGVTPEMALKRRTDILRESLDGRYKSRKERKKEEVTFDKLFKEYYLPNTKDNKNRGSWSTEEIYYRRWIKPVVGSLTLKNIKDIQIEKIKKRMVDAGKSPRTIQYTLATVRQAFNFARRNDLFEGDNPISKIRMPKVDNRRHRFLTHEEAEKLLVALREKSPKIYEMALVSLYCGLRAGEIFSLTWQDLDFEHGIMMLRDTKAGRDRAAFMTAAVKEMLLAKPKGEPDALVFPGRGGVKIKSISNSFDRIVKTLGFNEGITDARQRVVFHSLRHTFASWLVEGGADLYKVKTLLGHSTIALTERYSHLGNEALQETIKILENPTASRTRLESVNGGGK